jgi:hypothetical protein
MGMDNDVKEFDYIRNEIEVMLAQEGTDERSTELRQFAQDLLDLGFFQTGYNTSPIYLLKVFPAFYLQQFEEAYRTFDKLSKEEKSNHIFKFRHKFLRNRVLQFGKFFTNEYGGKYDSLKNSASMDGLRMLNYIYTEQDKVEQDHTKTKVETISKIKTDRIIRMNARIALNKRIALSEIGEIKNIEEAMGLTSESLYSQLGTKTQSENVIIDDKAGRKPAEKSASNYYEGDIKPEPNTIFVFGSNPEGRHGAGAAKIAVEKFGAIYDQGEGLQGNAYALPTKDLRVKENKGLRSIPESEIVKNIQTLYDVAKKNPSKKFKVSYRNTTKASLNGYTGLEMIDMFVKAGEIPSNIVFSKEWADTGKLKNSFNYIIAYRTKGNSFLEAFEQDNAIGNPWSHLGSGQNANIKFEEEQTPGYRNSTIKNAAADATIAIAVDLTLLVRNLLNLLY